MKGEWIQHLFVISERDLAWLRFLGVNDEEFKARLQKVIDDEVRKMIYYHKTGEEGECVFCHVTAAWVGHVPTCKLHPDNLPEGMR